jgi:formylglycine-generating enzyme required for sulfatase activity
MRQITLLIVSLLALLFISCKKDIKSTIEPDKPEVKTGEVLELKNGYATISIEINGVNITKKGIVWSTKQLPAIENNEGLKDYSSSDDGTISVKIGKLKSNIYYARAYATNVTGTTYGNQIEFTTPDSWNIDMVFVEGGSFSMGSKDIQPGDKWRWTENEVPQHNVILNSFYISKYEITYSQFVAFLNTEKIPTTVNYVTVEQEYNDRFPIKYENNRYVIKRDGYQNKPINYVSWKGAEAFCKWAGGRLATEAEWEFAAKGGLKSKGYIYAGSNSINSVAWWGENSGLKINNVGQKQPNELGIYDMSGNVWEWCNDWYDKNYYKASPDNNPKGPGAGTSKVIRGGGFYQCTAHDPRLPKDWRFCRVARRGSRIVDSKYERSESTGFRLVRDK